MSAVSPLFQKTVSGVRGTAAALSLICYAYMCGAVFIQVLGRYVFHFRIAEWAETATFAQVWLGVLGAGIAMRRGGNSEAYLGIDGKEFRIDKRKIKAKQELHTSLMPPGLVYTMSLGELRDLLAFLLQQR